MKYITSVQNPLIQHATKLQDRAYRQKHQECIAEGLRTCQTMYEAGLVLHYLFCTEDTYQEVASSIDIEPVIVSDALIKKISSTSTPSGIVGIFVIPKEISLLAMTPGLVLANITNPGNMGTLIRTAAAMRVKTVIIVEGCDPWSPKVIQATAGTIALVTIYNSSWDILIKHTHIPLCALVVEGGIKPEKAAIAQSLLVIGNEAHGLPQRWLNDCQTHITLAMPGGTESLNAAIAGSIALYIGYVTNNR
ncbi:MAG TPA: RNA methyltransferase [Candidatus Babeliales bacterium]|nr:RNA methyltransferase [Candidatus Babeliales bacterium]